MSFFNLEHFKSSLLWPYPHSLSFTGSRPNQPLAGHFTFTTYDTHNCTQCSVHRKLPYFLKCNMLSPSFCLKGNMFKLTVSPDYFFLKKEPLLCNLLKITHHLVNKAKTRTQFYRVPAQCFDYVCYPLSLV